MEPSRLDLIWLSGPEREGDRGRMSSLKAATSSLCGWPIVNLTGVVNRGHQRTVWCLFVIVVTWVVSMEWPSLLE